MKACLIGLMIAALLGATLIGPAHAENGLTKEQGEAILNELRQIRLLLEKQQKPPVQRGPAAAPPARVRIKLGGGYCLGREDAPLTLVEFTDYQCPYSKRFYATTFGDLKRDYIDTGKLRYVSRDLPLAFHKHAKAAAKAARCAGEQGRYWEMRDLLMKSSHPTDAAILDAARSLGLDLDHFQACLKAEEQAAGVDQDVAEANSVGITGTPTFVLGPTAKGAVEGIKIVGAKPYATFEAKIKELLSARPQ